MSGLLYDLRIAARVLGQQRAYTVAAVLILSLAIGATTAILSAVYAVALRPLPYRDPGRLVLLWHQRAGEPTTRGAMSPPDWLDYRRESRTLEDVAAVNSFGASLAGEGAPEQLQLGVVTANFFSVLGVRPFIGRDFTAVDDTPLDTRDPRNSSVVILDHGFWRRRFGGDRSVIGRTVRIGGTPMVVIGVLPREFRLYMPNNSGMSTDLSAWTPLRIDYAAAPRAGAYLKIVARVRPGTTLAQAQADVSDVTARLRAREPAHEAAGLRARVAPMQDDIVADVTPTLVALTLAVTALLVIACANVASLLLVRLAARSREILVRMALGATRWRLVRQLLAESGLLAVAAVVAGLGIAWYGLAFLLHLQPGNLPRLEEVAVDRAALGIAVASAVASLLFFGLAPAVLAARVDLASGLRERASSGGISWRWVRRGLVVGEVGLSVVLLAGAGLMTRSVLALQRTQIGFRPESVLTFRVSLPFTAYRRPENWSAYFAELEQRLAALPAVRVVGTATALPMSGDASLDPFALARGGDARPWGARTAVYRTVTPGYFAALGIPLRGGRSFGAEDRAGAPWAVVVDEALAARHWPGSSPVGRGVEVSVESFDRGYRVQRVAAEVVGVVGTTPVGRPDAEPPGTIYLAHAQQPIWNMAVAVAARGNPAAFVEAARRVVAETDANLPIFDVGPLSDRVDRVMAPLRFVLALLGGFAATALVLASLGLYAIIAYAVRLRAREFSVRVALGADPASIAWGVLREGLVLAGAGVAVGLVASTWLTRLLGRLLVGVTPQDPAALGAAAVVLVAVAAAASVVPARRVAALDPVRHLRSE